MTDNGLIMLPGMTPAERDAVRARRATRQARLDADALAYAAEHPLDEAERASLRGMLGRVGR